MVAGKISRRDGKNCWVANCSARPADLQPGVCATRNCPHSHIGVYPQKQRGLNYVGVAMPVGQITPKQMLRVAEIADLYGSGEIRLTVWQNFIIPNVPDAYVETVEKGAATKWVSTRSNRLLRGGLIACTGNSYCKFAQTNTKAHALDSADYLGKEITLDLPHQHPSHRLPEFLRATLHGRHRFAGHEGQRRGRIPCFHRRRFRRQTRRRAARFFPASRSEDLKPTLEKMLKGYLRHRATGRNVSKIHRAPRLEHVAGDFHQRRMTTPPPEERSHLDRRTAGRAAGR